MKNQEIAQAFERAADILALLDENTFRVLALRKVARAVDEMATPIEQLAAEGGLEAVPGIGKSSADRIREYLRGGRIAEFDDIAAQVPAGVLEIMKIPTVGPKTAALLWNEGGVSTVEALLKEIDLGEKSALLKIKGLGAKKLAKMKENLAFLAASSGRIPIGEALPAALELSESLRGLPGVQAVQYCGSLRRGKETIGDIDIAVAASADQGQAIADAVTAHPMCASVIVSGETKTSFRTRAGVQVDVRVVPPESFGAAIQYFTGSKEHNVTLRELAIKKGLKVNEWGVYRTAGGQEEKIAGATEESVYAALGLAWIPPEMRENHGEIDWALARAASQPPAKPKPKKDLSAAPAADGLVTLADLRGDLHMHTTASDGTCSIEEMIAEAKRRGYQYMAITDHSKSQIQANGLKADRLLEHIQAIHAAAREAAKSGMLVLAGTEVDILADGSLDYEDDLLAQLDWVIASPHSALSQETEPATQRLVKAAANPYVCVLGHPTGRLIPERRGLEPDMSKVIFAAARHGVALELSAHYMRLDVRDIHARMAVEAKVPLCINTDAHALAHFDMMKYGILTARRGWATPADVLNAWPVEKFQQWLKERKQMAAW
jgi:DNA polymerase (family X)